VAGTICHTRHRGPAQILDPFHSAVAIAITSLLYLIEIDSARVCK
jgi:hypothetical protein